MSVKKQNNTDSLFLKKKITKEFVSPLFFLYQLVKLLQ